MQGLPFMYDAINYYTSQVSPSTVHCKNTLLTNYFRRYLIQKAISVFEWKLPKEWSKNYFLYILYCWGYIAIVNTDRYGVIPQQCTLQGYNIFYQPKNVVISNPLLRNTMDLTIDRDAVLLKLQPDYGNIVDLVSYYADMMSLAAESIGVNFVNSKLAYVYTTSSKAGAESFKKLYDEIAAGNPAAVVDKEITGQPNNPNWNWFMQNIKQNYVADMLLSDMRKIEAMFDTDIGIPNANTDKKERLIKDEVNANNIETASKCALWLEELQEGCRKAREIFDIDISVDWRYKEAMAYGNDINSRNVQPVPDSI